MENEAIALFSTLGWETINAYQESLGTTGTLGRETRGEVVLIHRLRSALQQLNPDLPNEALQLAIEELTRDRSTSLEATNREIYQLLKNGIKVPFKTDEDEEQQETVKLIDWNTPDNNQFLLVSQFSVTGEIYGRRADLIGFVNGLPLVFIELKAHHQRLEQAYHKNLTDYKQTIPQLFWYNALVILSNGKKSRVGAITAEWEHFAEWKKINTEGETGIISLETIIRGTCDKIHLLDLTENFTFFFTAAGQLIKILGKNHQFLGVNNAVQAVQQIEQNRGKLGVFWHTQGSGKSYSMVFFSQKILRKLPGNWTFLILTDREDLDDQIYKNFDKAGAVTEPEKEVRAKNADHLKQLLREDHRYVFTLIQKFRTEKGAIYPKLSDRSDIIVIADEAHRSQYDTFAQNLRNALPNAGFIGFTGTPLLAGEEKTREEFGDYISVYNFRQSIEDRATVPLFYENRIPELQLTNEELNEDVYRIVETATLDEEEERKLEREFSREYHLITRNDRLEKIAEDIVSHFLGRGHQGKAMVIAIDRFTAVSMYDKVQHHWKQRIDSLKAQLSTSNAAERQQLLAQIAYLETTDMAVVVSSSQNEEADFKKKGLDIMPHRKRLVHESPGLDDKFKDADNPLRIVFVCAMWITGFDAPSCSTIYLDKPMKNHTLMQTIARANRVFGKKNNGLIVDYIGVFKNLQKALAIYGSASGGGIEEGDVPVKPKAALLEQLRGAIAEATEFCTVKGIDLSRFQTTQTAFERTKLWADAVEAILVNDDSKRTYFSLAGNITRLYKAILPDPDANEFTATEAFFSRLSQEIRNEVPDVDISEVKAEVEALLDSSITAENYVISSSATQSGKVSELAGTYQIREKPLIDLSQLDFEALKAEFAKGYQRTQAEKLKGTLNRKLQQMISLNHSRVNYLEKFQKMIEGYNNDSRNVELFFNSLIDFAQELEAEDKRAIAENLTEEELAIFDLLTKPEIALSKKEEQAVKQVAQQLLDTLKQEKLVLDWRKRQQSRASVRLTIEETLDQLPETYSAETYEQKCEQIYQHVYESYQGQGKSIYNSAA
jgi:type I restriction enzyme R subunit